MLKMCPHDGVVGCKRHGSGKWATAGRPMGAGWQGIRARVLEGEPMCRACGAPAITVDHIVPRVEGGTNDPSNLRPLCGLCRQRKDVRDAARGRARRWHDQGR